MACQHSRLRVQSSLTAHPTHLFTCLAQVSNCSSVVAPVVARTVDIAGGSSLLVAPPMDIYVEDTVADPSLHCWVSLYNSVVRHRACRAAAHVCRCQCMPILWTGHLTRVAPAATWHAPCSPHTLRCVWCHMAGCSGDCGRLQAALLLHECNRVPVPPDRGLQRDRQWCGQWQLWPELRSGKRHVCGDIPRRSCHPSRSIVAQIQLSGVAGHAPPALAGVHECD